MARSLLWIRGVWDDANVCGGSQQPTGGGEGDEEWRGMA